MATKKIGIIYSHGAPFEFLRFIFTYRERLYKNHNNISIVDCSRDIHLGLSSSDAVVAVCDHSDFSVGYGIATAVERFRIPLLLVYKEGLSPNELIPGPAFVRTQAKTYKDMEDLLEKTKGFIEQI